MLEYLALGKIKEFRELATYPEFVGHLRAYGLLNEDSENSPTITIPVVGRYIALDVAHREGRQTIMDVVRLSDRKTWLSRRIQEVLSDIKTLEGLIEQHKQPGLYGPNSIPETHRFAEVGVVANKTEFRSFIGTCHECFVEGIDAFGQFSGKKRYFFDVVVTTYPALGEALHRVRVYRHWQAHRILNADVERIKEEFLHKDLEGRSPERVEELWFVLQQCVMDALLWALQKEIGDLTN